MYKSFYALVISDNIIIPYLCDDNYSYISFDLENPHSDLEKCIKLVLSNEKSCHLINDYIFLSEFMKQLTIGTYSICKIIGKITKKIEVVNE